MNPTEYDIKFRLFRQEVLVFFFFPFRSTAWKKLFQIYNVLKTISFRASKRHMSMRYTDVFFSREKINHSFTA